MSMQTGKDLLYFKKGKLFCYETRRLIIPKLLNAATKPPKRVASIAEIENPKLRNKYLQFNHKIGILDYIFCGWPVTNPRTQQIIFLINDIEIVPPEVKS